MTAFPSQVLCLLAGAVLLATSCNRSGSTDSAQPEEPPPPAAPANPSPPVSGLPPGHPKIDMSAQGLPPGATADAANPQWTVPTDWQQGKSSSIRKASFAVNGAGGQSADIAVTAFPGEVGDLLSNINRWRGQIGLSPVTGEQVDQFTTRLDVNGAETTVVEITGDKPPTGKTHPQAMLVATLAHAGNSWFFKMTGDAPLVAEQKESFLQFVRSVKF